MIKEVPCMDCDGKGFIVKFSEYSVWSERCPNCGGTGIVKVPMTNADRIRAMTDEELAAVLCTADFCGYCGYERDNGICHYIETHPDGRLFDGCVKAALRYLQATSEEET